MTQLSDYVHKLIMYTKLCAYSTTESFLANR